MSTHARLELLGRPGCCLCDEAARVLADLPRDYDVEIVKINVDEDPALQARYGDGVPVVRHEGRTWARHKVEAGDLRRRLDAIGARRHQ